MGLLGYFSVTDESFGPDAVEVEFTQMDARHFFVEIEGVKVYEHKKMLRVKDKFEELHRIAADKGDASRIVWTNN